MALTAVVGVTRFRRVEAQIDADDYQPSILAHLVFAGAIVAAAVLLLRLPGAGQALRVGGRRSPSPPVLAADPRVSVAHEISRACLLAHENPPARRVDRPSIRAPVGTRVPRAACLPRTAVLVGHGVCRSHAPPPDVRTAPVNA